MNARIGYRQTGFTLVEIAIVLVIIGLILGGVLKGQELVTSARVRNIADQQNAMKAAFFAFQDRYKAVPGDYAAAGTNLPGLSDADKVNGDGDGLLAASSTDAAEQVWAFLHLTAAGFISCAQCITGGKAATPGTPSTANSPTNAYGGALGMAYDSNFGDPTASTPPNAANNVKTGPNVPSNILAEVDSKLDDGNPYTGSFQFSNYKASTTAPIGVSGTAGCVVSSGAGTSTVYSWNRQTPASNCGAAYTF